MMIADMTTFQSFKILSHDFINTFFNVIKMVPIVPWCALESPSFFIQHFLSRTEQSTL